MGVVGYAAKGRTSMAQLSVRASRNYSLTSIIQIYQYTALAVSLFVTFVPLRPNFCFLFGWGLPR